MGLSAYISTALILILYWSPGNCKGTEEGNALVDRILMEGSQQLMPVSHLSHMETVQQYTILGLPVSVKSLTATVTRNSTTARRTTDTRNGFYRDNFHVIQVDVDVGEVVAELDNVEVQLGENIAWRWDCRTKLALSEPFHAELVLDRPPDCVYCDANFFPRDQLQVPELRELRVEGWAGGVLSWLLRAASSFRFFEQIVLDLYSPAFYRTTVQPFWNVTVAAVCNCKPSPITTQPPHLQ